MQDLIMIFHILLCVSIIVLVLLQQGKGAEVGASFGSGASTTMFGSQGAMSFLVKLTAVLAFLFFITSVGLTYYVAQKQRRYLNQPHQQTTTVPTTSLGNSGKTK